MIYQKEKNNFFFKGDEIRVMIKNEIYCYISCFMKWNINKKTSYIVESKKDFVERFTFLIWKTKQKVSLDKELKAKEDQKVNDKIIIKSTYRSNNRSK